MTELLKKDNLKWNPQAEAAFIILKRAMTQALILALPNFSKPFVIETDACDIGVGAILI